VAQVLVPEQERVQARVVGVAAALGIDCEVKRSFSRPT
jgi:hypothetical protein